MNIADARLKFAIRSKMTKSVMMNFKGVSEYEKKGWKCDTCGELDTQEHIMMCPAYKELRADKVLSNDKDIVEYFQLALFQFLQYHYRIIHLLILSDNVQMV